MQIFKSLSKTWESFSKFAIGSMNALFFLLFSGLSFSALFRNNSTFSYRTLPSLAALLFIAAILFFAAWLIHRLQKQKSLYLDWYFRHEKAGLFFLFFLIFIIQLSIVSFTHTSIGWDVGMVMNVALSGSPNEHAAYFSRYPNNFFLFLFFRFLGKTLGRIINIWLAAGLVNILFVDIALFLSCFCAKKCFGRKTFYCVFALSALLFAFFPWLIVPYSDTLSMPFPIGIFACFLCFREAEKRPKKIMFAVLAGLLTWIGYLIKPTVIIAWIAVAIVGCFLPFSAKKSFRQHAGFLLLTGILFFLGSIIWQSFLYHQQWMEIDPQKAAPAEHFFMMGLNQGKGTYGAYKEDDVAFTFSFATLEERKEADLQVAFQRLQEYGPGGYLRFLWNKARWVTSEGIFFWGKEGHFADFSKSPFNDFQNLFYPTGSFFPLFLYLAQGVWLLTLFLLIIPFWPGCRFRKNKSFEALPLTALLRCALLGILLFILLFEGRSRYLILYLPCFSLLSGWALSVCFQRLFAQTSEEPL